MVSGTYFHLNNVKRNIGKSHYIYVFQCILFKDSYIDNTFKDESIIESKIINFINEITEVISYK